MIGIYAFRLVVLNVSPFQKEISFKTVVNSYSHVYPDIPAPKLELFPFNKQLRLEKFINIYTVARNGSVGSDECHESREFDPQLGH